MADKDMIRRGNVLPTMNEFGFGGTKLGDAVAALPAVTPKVKQLVWDAIAERVQEAVGFNAIYQIRIGTDGLVRWQGEYMGVWNDAASVDDAKAVCQADHEARILANLDL